MPPLPELGDHLPQGTRFAFVPELASVHGQVVAFVPCEKFEHAGKYLLYLAGRHQIGRCRAHGIKDKIYVALSTGEVVVATDRFREIVEGQVIGIALFETSAESR